MFQNLSLNIIYKLIIFEKKKKCLRKYNTLKYAQVNEKIKLY